VALTTLRPPTKSYVLKYLYFRGVAHTQIEEMHTTYSIDNDREAVHIKFRSGATWQGTMQEMEKVDPALWRLLV